MSPFLLLNPAGTIAFAERNVIIVAVSLMLLVAIPTFIILFTFARKYRAGNPDAKHSPDLEHNAITTFVIWAVPITLIGILSIINWTTTHALDPYNAIVSNAKPIPVQVIALRWKFLFIYPEQGIATVNFLEIPENTPIHFDLTADAPMSSFWIPQLGSQIYAMPAMSTQLNLMATQTGDFRGLDTEINGAGFSGMKFVARSVSQSDFDGWVRSVRQGANLLDSENSLDMNEYDRLAFPSENNAAVYYTDVDNSIYNNVIMKYMVPPGSSSSTQTMPNMPGMPSGMQM